VQRNSKVNAVKKRILLVEDNRLLRVAAERTLMKAEYDLISAVDGEAALSMSLEHLPDLILLDMMLPKLDGVGVLRALKLHPRTAGIPVIVLTGLGKANEAKLLQEGAAAYCMKTDWLLENDYDTLLITIERVLSKQPTTETTTTDKVPSA
jgi:CheY-like chemotaxis protein